MFCMVDKACLFISFLKEIGAIYQASGISQTWRSGWWEHPETNNGECNGLNLVLPNAYVEVLALGPQNVTAFRDFQVKVGRCN